MQDLKLGTNTLTDYCVKVQQSRFLSQNYDHLFGLTYRSLVLYDLITLFPNAFRRMLSLCSIQCALYEKRNSYCHNSK